MAEAYQNMPQDHALQSPDDPEQQQTSFPSLSTFTDDLTEDHQTSEQLTKLAEEESEDAEPMLKRFR